jgi:transcriptional regulator NrdR family protein
MAKFFIKKGGKKVPFKPAKIPASVRGACKDIHLTPTEVKKVVSKVAGPVLAFARKRVSVKASVIRTKLLAGLRKAEPKAAKAWLKYEKKHRGK